MGKVMNLQYEFKDDSITNVQEINSSFASGSLKVMYLGQNRNGSEISRKAVEAALPSLYNVPIVCHYDYETNEIGGHDIDVVEDRNGDLKIRTLTEPCGTVPESATFRFEQDRDEDGNIHEYLCIDGVLLWKRQDVFSHIMNDLGGKVSHSMEINVRDGSRNKASGIYSIRDFEFTALCLLEAAEPCFQGSQLEVFSANHFKEKMTEMMAELKEMYTLVNTPKTEIDIEENFAEGGNEPLEEKIENLSAEELEENNSPAEEAPEAEAVVEPESIEEPVAEEQESVAEEATVAEEPAAEAAEAPQAEPAQDFALQHQLEGEIRAALCEEMMEMPWGAEPRYSMIDYDPDTMMVYCEDCEDWKMYGFSYEMNGDKVVIHYESKQRMKCAFVPFDEGDSEEPNVFADFQQKYQQNIDELKAFKLNVENEKLNAEREEVLAQFDDLSGVEAYEAIVAEAANYSVEALEEKCFAIRGKLAAKHNFALEQKAPKIIVKHEDHQVQPYGGLVEKYLGSNK